MNLNFQFKIGFIDRTPTAVYNPIAHKFIGGIGEYYNKRLELYDSINYTVVLHDQRSYGNCDLDNCTGLIGLIQQGEVDFGEKPYSFATIPDSITGLKPGSVLSDVSCTITSALPKVGIIREDVVKSLSIFTTEAIIFLTFLYLFLFSIPFILWYFKYKFCDIRSNSPSIIWSLVGTIFLQDISRSALFYNHSLRFVWLSIMFALFFTIALYSSSFKTDLASSAPIKTIDSLEDVAKSDRMPLWMEEPLCKIMVEHGPLRAKQEVLTRGKYKPVGDFVAELEKESIIENYVFIITEEEADNIQLTYCNVLPDSPAPQWYSAKRSFPVYLLFSVLNSKLPPHATKVINLLHEKQFEGGFEFYVQRKWKYFYEKLLDRALLLHETHGCLHKTSISFHRALYSFDELDIQNYELLFKYFLYFIPICILSLIGEHLYFRITHVIIVKNINYFWSHI